MNGCKGQQLYLQAKRLIPGGTQLLSKRPEMFLPEQWPAYYSRARGVEVWDLDGNKYVDMSYNGLGACILGAGDPEVDEAVRGAIESGAMSTLNAPEEVELAQLLCTLHPWAEMVRYARTGGEAMAVAVRIARARTGREIIAFCGYHGWHDWYLAANLAADKALDGHLLSGLAPAGVPRGLLGTVLPFRYNHVEDLQEIVSRHGDGLAAIVMEPLRNQEPGPGFLETIQEMAEDVGAVLVMDEISVGFRLNTGGAHLVYGIEPDIAVFGKAIGNGYAMAAVIGKADVMQAAQDTFISSTYWTERIGPVAALATIAKHQRCAVPTHVSRVGGMVQSGWASAAERAGLPITIEGVKPMGHFQFHGREAPLMRTLFTQLLLERGFLATNAFYATYSHQDSQVEAYLSAVQEAFCVLSSTRNRGDLERLLKGPVAHVGFQRLT